MPNQQLVADLADQLWEAGRARAPIEPLTDRHPELEVDDGYAIQTRNIERRVAAGAHIRGRKIGLTSRAMQELLGVTEPDYGVLLDDMFVEDGDEIPLETMAQPRVEAEMAFIPDQDLTGPGSPPPMHSRRLRARCPRSRSWTAGSPGDGSSSLTRSRTTPHRGRWSSAASSPGSPTSTRGWSAWR